MDRKDFLKNCGFACMGSIGIAGILQSCSTTKLLNGKITGDDIIILVSDFETRNGSNVYFKKYLVIQNDMLQYPICVYRFNENEYSALWMQCSHQGSELQAAGDHLHCASHGSEFNNKGINTQGPAELNLRTFPVVASTNNIFIDLRSS